MYIEESNREEQIEQKQKAEKEKNGPMWDVLFIGDSQAQAGQERGRGKEGEKAGCLSPMKRCSLLIGGFGVSLTPCGELSRAIPNSLSSTHREYEWGVCVCVCVCVSDP
eukprot:GGOE01054729.1.p5 GENE.GGOE01054729.1~~GGOE01054729.1.p5  ORF type:complete len:109 (-),score=5.22 GGOE01054729.1:206-532(-)